MDQPLSEKDKLFIRENYNGLYNNTQPQPLIDLLYKRQKKVLSKTDLIQLNAKGMTDEKKLIYLIFNILLRRGTYSDLRDVRESLIECKQEAAVNFLCDIIIEEPEEVDKDPIDGVLKSSSSDSEEIEIVKTPGNSTFFDGNKNDHLSDGNESSSDSDMEVVRTAGKGKTASASPYLVRKFKETFLPSKSKKRNKKKDKSDGGSHSGSDSDKFDGRNVEPLDDDDQHKTRLKVNRPPVLRRIKSFTDAFIHYETKEQGPEFGCGLCLIFALFTGDLTGYLKDRSSLTAFFSGLNYEIRPYENLTKKEMFDKIRETQKYIEQKKTFDRLVVVVLTHGKADGLMTCADDTGVIEETVKEVDEYGNVQHVPVKTKVDEIVENFKHDKLPSLKDMPKLFLIQACRGQNVVKAANRTSLQPEEPEDDNGIELQFRPQTPIDADICVCSATTEDHPSLVNPHSGSWFIQKTLDIFKKHYDRQHVVDMMTVVNLAVAELRGKLEMGDGSYQLALQIPCIFSTLRRQFYLINPSVTYQIQHSISDSNLQRSQRKQNGQSSVFG